MKIYSNFDSGNIEIVKIENSDDIQLKIRKDTQSDFLQWFHFRLSGAKGKTCNLKIINAGETTYPEGWKDYKACASYDRITWFRVPTTFDGKVLTIAHEPEYDAVFYAYFAPFSYEQHLDLLAEVQQYPHCRLYAIGNTVEGRDLDMLQVGQQKAEKKKVWVIARQHPGESMTSWFMQGFLGRLLDQQDPLSIKLMEKAVFYIVPHMNPDGAVNGNLRANAAGANLNREWAVPDIQRSPEVFHVRNKMDETGMDFCLDVHGDEALPYNFVAGSEGNPGYSERIDQLHRSFVKHWMDVSPDFQDKYGYDKDKPGEANMTVCTNQISQRFDCLALTLEMPFKDNNDMPDPFYGWSPPRAIKLGESAVNPIYHLLDKLDS